MAGIRNVPFIFQKIGLFLNYIEPAQLIDIEITGTLKKLLTWYDKKSMKKNLYLP